jgi:uncharacterized protein YegP (UPF0339 family)
MLQRMFVVLVTAPVFWLSGSSDVVSFTGQLSAAQAGEAKLTFEIYQDASKEYRWRLKRADDKLLATAGQGFSAKADCRKSVDRIINNLDKQKFEVYEDKGKEFRWRLKASNGQVVAASSGAYATKADCEMAIDLIKKGAPKAEVSEEKAK